MTQIRYLTDRQLADRYNVHRGTIWRWAASGVLPKPVQVAPGTTRWRLDEIEARDAEREAGRAA